MTKEELIQRLTEIPNGGGDAEEWHIDADDALLAYINDPEISEAYRAIKKWYA